MRVPDAPDNGAALRDPVQRADLRLKRDHESCRWMRGSTAEPEDATGNALKGSRTDGRPAEDEKGCGGGGLCAPPAPRKAAAPGRDQRLEPRRDARLEARQARRQGGGLRG